tara:strand:+ start:270 stop:521 length:252 start_codon:yes stop_codon:yes gene_type:complete
MFDYSCHLCGNTEEWCKDGYNLCAKCTEVKKIVAVYTIESCLKTLKDVYVREKTPIENRTKAQQKEYNLRERGQCGSTPKPKD